MFVKHLKRKNANAINKNIRKRAVKKNISRLKPIKNTEEAFVIYLRLKNYYYSSNLDNMI
jgi:hypothetical protein